MSLARRTVGGDSDEGKAEAAQEQPERVDEDLHDDLDNSPSLSLSEHFNIVDSQLEEGDQELRRREQNILELEDKIRISMLHIMEAIGIHDINTSGQPGSPKVMTYFN